MSKLIRDIQCAPLIIYLAIVTNVLTEGQAKIIVETKIKILEQSEKYNSKNIRFAEKREVISKIGNKKDWAEKISKKLVGIQEI